jgi:hypothetical protein
MKAKQVKAEDIEKLIPALLEKDIQLGYKFLKERKLEELFDLVESDIIKLKKRLKANPEEELLKARLNDLNDLHINLIIYMDNRIKDMDIAEYLEEEAIL